MQDILPYIKIFTMIQNKYYPNKSVRLINMKHVYIINIAFSINVGAEETLRTCN